MTDEQIQKNEDQAEKDAEAFLIMLLVSDAAEFHADVGRFYINGQSVSITTIREYLQRLEKRYGKRFTNLTAKLNRGDITVEEWRREFESGIKSAHIISAALALGSIAVSARNKQVQARIASELDYADKFVNDIINKQLSESRITARAKSYLMAATVTYGQIEQKVRDLVGKQTEARRIRRASESCPGCIDWAYRWVPIAEMPAIGSLQCGGRCRCYIEYR